MFQSGEYAPINVDKSNVNYKPLSVDGIEAPTPTVTHTDGDKIGYSKLSTWLHGFVLLFATALFCVSFSLSLDKNKITDQPIEGSFLMNDFPPYSIRDPRELGALPIQRTANSKPGTIFGGLVARRVPLPTNIWCENLFLGQNKSDIQNKVFQIPYVVDLAGPIIGVRTHSLHLLGAKKSVIMSYEPDSGITMGAVEDLGGEHVIIDDGYTSVTHVAVQLEWRATSKENPRANIDESSMRSPIVRGSPYTSMEYVKSTPLLVATGLLRNPIIIDESIKHICGDRSKPMKPFLVEKEIMLQVETTDHTWMVFVSRPTEFTCLSAFPEKNHSSDPMKNTNYFEIRATQPMEHGMVRLALVNNCTLGHNAIHCDNGKPKDARLATRFANLIRSHSNVYPTGGAKVNVAFPSGIIVFDWKPAYMNRLGTPRDIHQKINSATREELLMYALPHQQDQLIPQIGSSNEVLDHGCVPTLQGEVCPVRGGAWLLQEKLLPVSFNAPRPIRKEVLPAVLKSLREDLQYEIPLNYRKGAGDTYFSGKMLAKLARILLIAEEVGYTPKDQIFSDALTRLKEGTEIWLNGSALAPFLYDSDWGGLISCGCDFDEDYNACFNKYPTCPSLSDPGQNFGNAFYNDHHFHYGYHIYAAAVIVKYDHVWGRKFHERVLLLIRDIANPSHEDPFFPTWRHKDWYLGSSWASGIVTQEDKPYPNGRNEESSAEAIAAYEAVALYGLAATQMYSDKKSEADWKAHSTASLVWQMGRLLMTTEVKSAQRYWHVRAPAFGVKRVYPDVYEPKVVGMLWSMLAELQTWFGNEEWKAYGIQVITITPASELRDEPDWVAEMLPLFNASCAVDPTCEEQGWSVIVDSSAAVACHWEYAMKNTLALPDDVFESAGGNGQSRSNSLWWLGTRPCA